MTRSIYISGPIMAPNPDRADGLVTEELLELRKRKFHQVTATIRQDVGPFTLVINPLDIEACGVPSHSKPVCEGVETGKHSWQCFLRYDLEQLVMCHEVVMLEGWEGSPGATVEKLVAEMLGLEILYWCTKHESAHRDPCNEKGCKGV